MLLSRIVRVVPLLVAGAFITASQAAVPAPIGPSSQEVRAFNGEALRLQSEARRQKSQAVDGRAAQSLERRQKALRSLMDRDPEAAAAIALPDKVLQQLGQTFPTQTANIEQRGSWDGEIEYLIEDDLKLKSHRSIFKLHRGGETLDVKFAGREPPSMKSGQKLRLRGVRSKQIIAATEAEVLDAFMGAGAGTLAQDANAAQCLTTGAQSILTVLVTLPNYGLPSVVTPDYMRGALFGSPASSPNFNVDDFWQQASDGKTWVDPASTVVGPISLSSDFNRTSAGTSNCDNYGLRDAVIAAIDSQVDFRNYSRIQIVMPNNGACGWSGTANLGCRTLSSPGDGTFTASVAWLRADQITTRQYAVELISHELGHNLTLAHANSRAFGAEPLGAPGTAGSITEYGDSFSTMGSWNLGFYAAPQAANQLGWLSQGANYTTVESAGTYTIQNYEARPAGVKALKVRRGTGNNAWLWLESRQPVNAYSSSLYATAHGGALIHYEDSFTSSDSHLLDFNANTSGNFSDAPLQVGRTWSDPYSNLTLTVNSISSTGMTVTVNYGAKTCVASEPTVTLSPMAASAEQGKSTQLAVTVRNNSTAECGNEVFALASAAAGSITTTLGTTSITVSPGQVVQTTLNVAVPGGFALGTYPVSVAASGSTSKLTGSGAANVTVTEPVVIVCSTAPPSLSASPTDLSLMPGTSGSFAVAVRNNSSQACSAETYSLASVLPAGWTGGVSGASVTVAPGATNQTSVIVGVPSGSALATYPVSFSLRDGSGTVRGTASASVRVATTPAPTPPPPSGTCTRGMPSIEMSPGLVSIEQGGAMQLAVTVRSNSSDGCGAETIRLASVVPKGWSDAFGGNEVSLAPGDIARLSLSVAVPGTFQTGTYSVLARVTSADSGMQAEAVANITVTKPAPPPCTAGTPTLGVSSSSATVLAGGTIQLTLTAGNTNTSTCEAEAFGVGASVPSGWAQSLGTGALTIASGTQDSTTLTVQVPASQPAGTFQVGTGVTGAKSGLKATQVVSVTVEVPAPPPTPTPTPTPDPTPVPPTPTPDPTPVPPTPEPTPVPPAPEPTPTPNPTPNPTPPVTPEKPVTPPSSGQIAQLFVVVSKKNRGSVAVTETGQGCWKKCTFGIAQSSTVTLQATAVGRYAFAGWGGACSASGTAPTCTVTMDAAKSVTAVFVKRKS